MANTWPTHGQNIVSTWPKQCHYITNIRHAWVFGEAVTKGGGGGGICENGKDEKDENIETSTYNTKHTQTHPNTFSLYFLKNTFSKVRHSKQSTFHAGLYGTINILYNSTII